VYIWILLFVCFIGLVILGKEWFTLKTQLKRYSRLADAEDETKNVRKKALKMKSNYEQLVKRFDELSKEVGSLESERALIDYGLYEPRYELGSSDHYKAEIVRIRDKQKELIKSNKAMTCDTNWSIGGNKRAGEVMTKKIHKIALNAFNVECDNLISKVKYNNVDLIVERIGKLAARIEKSVDKWGSRILPDFINLKEQELFLVHEYQEKVQDEREEQKRIKEQMREEERVRKEYEEALRDAEIEERNYERALTEARNEIDRSTKEQKLALTKRIEELESKLEDAHKSKERVLSMAQQTKRGYVYIISNIGSFGANTYKIGMTRRLEPMDRVRELGDASVPFSFDVHALIFSDDAPALESSFHKFFNNRRRNRVNCRKEFFDISLEEIEEFANSFNLELTLTKSAEAKEYHETLALKALEVQSVNELHSIDDLDFDLDKDVA
jgi:hypothetical protein